MGIADIFEPTRADFSPMTTEAGIYAKHIEQAISLNIRTLTNNNLRRKLLLNFKLLLLLLIVSNLKTYYQQLNRSIINSYTD